MSCPACGAQVPEGSRFCPSCGHELTTRTEERRIATVLFADLVGFTTLSETRDPEQVKRLVGRAFNKLTADITAYGGVVDKVLGDAIVALFGAPVAHEDDAERAVRAALSMQRTLAAESAELEAPIQLRIGVNTGEVIVGVVGGDYTAMGDAVNTASRLQTAAPPGGVLVGPATHAATRNAIRYTDVGRLEAKGRVAPVDAWQAEAAILPPGYRHRRDTPLVGRDEELGMLQHALNAAVTRSRAHLILLLGEAGVGKTRLAEEVADTAAAVHDAVVLEGRCVPYGEANVWWPVAEAIRDAVGLAGDAPVEVARTVVAKAVALALSSDEGTPPVDGTTDAEAEVERIVAGLLHLLGYDGPLTALDPQRAREEANRSVLSFIEASSAARPVVVILSDLHWADGVVLEMIDALMDRLGRERFVLVATARPELGDRWSAGAGRHNQLVINLDPLDREATAVLLDLLADGELPSDVEALLLDRSGGNPFFLEELVALVEETAAAAAAAGSVAHSGFGDEHSTSQLPDTLRGLVSARLDSLPSDERRLLEDAAVWGRRGKIAALERMGAHDRRPDIGPAIASLTDKEILVVDGESWRFRSDLVREVAYGTLTKADRARAHHGIAFYLEAHGPEPHRADEWLVDVVAHHYAHAAELVREVGLVPDVEDDVVERALRWVEEAAARARGSQVLPVSVRMFTQALGLVGPDTCERRVDLLLSRAVSLADSRQLVEAVRDADEAEMIATDLGYVGGLARVAFVRGLVAEYEGRLDDAVEILGDAVELFREAGDPSGEADALRNIGLTEIFRDDMAGAEASIADSLELYRRIGDRRGEAWSLQQMAWISFMEERAGEAEERLRIAAETFAELGDTGGQAWVRGLLAYVRFQQGDLDEARQLGDACLIESRERGDRWAEGMMLLLGGGTRLWSGEAAQALPLAEDALQLFRLIGDRFGTLQAQFLLGRVLVMLGRLTDGFRVLEGLPVSFGEDREKRFASGVTAAAAVQVGDTMRASAAIGPVESTDLDPHVLGDVDRLVAIGLHRLQMGCIEEGVELLSLAGEGREGTPARPYALSALALGLAALGGQDDEALEVASSIDHLPRASYLDRSYARMAIGLVHARQGDVVGATVLEGLVESADSVDDQVLQAVARLALARGLELLDLPTADAARDDAEDRVTDVGLPATGWRTLIDAIATAATLEADPRV